MGINTEPKAETTTQSDFEPMDVSPTKQSPYAEARDRKRLGKRILKAVQLQLEAALKAEADISNKPLDTLLKEMDGMLDASLELRQPSITVSQEEAARAEHGGDVVMVDAADNGQIIVAEDEDPEDDRAEDAEDRMDVDEGKGNGEDNIEVNTSTLGKSAKVNGVMSSNASVADLDKDGVDHKGGALPNGLKSSDTPPGEAGYGVPVSQPAHQGPLTPPQSNGSLGREPTDTLNDGGIPWFLKGFHLEGTTAAEEQWTGRDAVRSLSEDLTDMDEEELNGLEFDVEDSTITASPADASKDSYPTSTRKRSSNGKFRKGTRTSARRR